jgi:hypothetical protein
MTKVFVVLTAVLSIAASVLFVSAAAQWGNAKELTDALLSKEQAALTQRDQIQDAMVAALAVKDDSLAAKQAELTKQSDQIADLTAQVAALESQKVRSDNEKFAAEAGRTKLQEILGVVTAGLDALRTENKKLLEDKIDYETRVSRLNTRVLELTANTTILGDQVRNLKERNYAYEQEISKLQQQIAAAPRQPAAAGAPATPAVAGPIRGEVLQVDGSYATVNIGETSGIVAGMVLMVHRGESFLGELEVRDVQPQEAGGRLRTLQGEVHTGDRVSYRPS